MHNWIKNGLALEGIKELRMPFDYKEWFVNNYSRRKAPMLCIYHIEKMTFAIVYKKCFFSRERNLACAIRFCNLSSTGAVVESNETEENEKSFCRKKMSYFVPSSTLKQTDTLDTVTGITIGSHFVSWMKVKVSNLEIIDWNAKPLSYKFLTKTNEFNTLQLAYNIRKSLPESDLYLMETFSVKGRYLFERLNYIHLSSMLTVLLNGINSDDEMLNSKVVFQKKYIINSLHDLVHSSERISVTPVVENLLQKTLKFEEKEEEKVNDQDIYTSMQIKVKFLDAFMTATLAKKEDLSTSFLLTLTFLDVYVFNNPNSWNKIFRKRRKFEVTKEKKN